MIALFKKVMHAYMAVNYEVANTDIHLYEVWHY